MCLEWGIVEDNGVTAQTKEYDLAEYDIIHNDYHIAHPFAGRRDTPRKTLISIIISFAVLSMGNTWIISIQTDIISCADQKVRRRQEGHGVRQILSASLILENENDLVEYPDFISKVDFHEQGIKWGGIEDWRRKSLSF